MQEQKIMVWCENDDGTIKDAKIFKEVSQEVELLRYHRDLITTNGRAFRVPLGELIAPRINTPI